MTKNGAYVAYKSATEGIVLLKNQDNVLPLKREKKIALIGNGCFEFLKGGKGSADVTSEYTIDLISGLKSCDANVKEASLIKCDKYDIETCNEFAKDTKCALVMIARDSGEGDDRTFQSFCLSADEIELFERLENSNFNEIIVILNTTGIIDVATISQYSKVKAILLAWLPGMEGGNAICDVLYGKVTPSGKLTNTIAHHYTDYPSSTTFNASPMCVNYVEDIFVGYRYFETFAKEKVAYPFGFGLSYTTFKYENINFSIDEKRINVTFVITNTGNYSGKEVVQVYSSSPKSKVLKSAIELRAYKKTKLLKPSESERITISFDVKDLTYFDEERAAFVLEKGIYLIYLGNSVRNLQLCGQYEQLSDEIIDQTSLKFTFGLPCKLGENGEFEKTGYWDNSIDENLSKVITAGAESSILETTKTFNNCEDQERNNKYSLYDVVDNKISLDEFVKNISTSQLIEMTMGQPPALIRGTAGIGNIAKLGIPNPQTADGPAGIRSTRPTICFPCATLLACTWNEDILYEVGVALGEDAIKNGVDILLAPGLNIQRNPLCGRNFEYYSEDPIISGKSAASIIRGVQSKGVGATIKHFALNNKEENRHESNSIASERAIREIYLKGYKIAILEGKPWCVMTAYNSINGVRSAAHKGLLKGVLREEWLYDGLVMTDWRVHSHLWQEIKAGSNVKMPCGYPEEIELAKEYYSKNLITRAELETCAKYILKTVMKTRRFKEKYFGKTQDVREFNVLDFICLSTTCSGTKVEKDGTTSLTHIGLDNRAQDTFVDYRINNDNESEFILKITASCLHEGQKVDIYIDGKKATEVEFIAPKYDFEKFFVFQSTQFKLSKGVHDIRSFVRNSKHIDTVHYKKWEFIKNK